MIEEYLTGLPDHLEDVAFPPASDRAVWDGLLPGVGEAIVRRGEAYLGYAWPSLTCRDYLAFSRTGERTGFEEKYFARRRALCALTLAECAEHRGRFLDDLADGIWAVCEESGWQLPPHNNYVRDTKPLPLPDADRPVPDLFACETAATLSLICSLLGPELHGIDAALCRRIHREVDRRVVTPYLWKHFWWMGNGDEPMCNWTAWCTQNVLLAVFSSGYSQSIKRAAVKQASYSLDCFLKDYGPDGCCEEGAMYYRHAGLTLWGALEVLNAASGGKFASLFQEEKIRNIAAYIVNVYVDGDFYLNYADCSPKPGPCGAREYLFGRRTGNGALCALAAEDFARREDMPVGSSLFDGLLEVLCANRLAEKTLPVPPPENVFYPSTGLWITRDGAWCVSVRAGHNGGSHGHCDAGSLTVYHRGRPLLIDIGVESYTAKTFSADRYSLWTIRSDWHNLPTIDGVIQGSGSGYAPSNVTLRQEDIVSGIAMELASAYPKDNFSYQRTVTLERGKRLTVEDSYQGEGRAVLSLLFCEKPVWHDQCLETPNGGIHISGGIPKIEPVPISDPRLRQCWPDTLYRALIPVEDRLLMEFIESERSK